VALGRDVAVAVTESLLINSGCELLVGAIQSLLPDNLTVAGSGGCNSYIVRGLAIIDTIIVVLRLWCGGYSVYFLLRVDSWRFFGALSWIICCNILKYSSCVVSRPF